MNTLEEQIGQMMVVGFDGLTAPDYLLDWLRAGRVGGVILFQRNIESPEQVAALTASLHEAAKHPLMISIDQEGGTVARLRGNFSESPGALALSSIREDREEAAERVCGVLGAEMAALGINWTYAPVVDLIYNADNPTVGTRSFGTSPQIVGRMGASAMRGFQNNGVAASAKHFPGLGDTAIDTHLDLPKLNTAPDHLLAVDLVPYRALIADGLATVMTTHTIFTAIDAEHPATLSGAVIGQLLRGELGFDGVVTSDCMEMRAVGNHYGLPEATIKAANAGVDMILYSHTAEQQSAAYGALLDAARRGDVAAETIHAANRRIAELKARFPVGQINAGAVHTAAHQAIMAQAARDAVIYVAGDGLPLDGAAHVTLVEFAARAESIAEEAADGSRLSYYLRERLPELQAILLPPRPTPADVEAVRPAIDDSSIMVFATRNAHMHPAQREAVEILRAGAANVILLALRNPYDAALGDGATVLCTCGDSIPSLQASVAALMGDFAPSGVLPVAVSS